MERSIFKIRKRTQGPILLLLGGRRSLRFAKISNKRQNFAHYLLLAIRCDFIHKHYIGRNLLPFRFINFFEPYIAFSDATLPRRHQTMSVYVVNKKSVKK